MRALPLDFLRILLCLLVIDHHSSQFWSAGGVAVVGFFVLSGYFLEKGFERAPDFLNWSDFYKKKVFSFLPEYVVAFILAFTINLGAILFLGKSFPKINVSPFWLTNCVRSQVGVSWFVNCLFLFFAFAPVLFCLHKTKWGIQVAFISALMYGVILSFMCDKALWWDELYFSCQINIAYFLGGMFARRMWRNVRLSGGARWFIVLICAVPLAAIAFIHPLPLAKGGNAYVSCLLFVLLMPMLDSVSVADTIPKQAVVKIASFTYAMYLFHVPVANMMYYVFARVMGAGTHSYKEFMGTYTMFIALVTVTLLVSVIFDVIKKPVLRKIQTQK